MCMVTLQMLHLNKDLTMHVIITGMHGTVSDGYQVVRVNECMQVVRVNECR